MKDAGRRRGQRRWLLLLLLVFVSFTSACAEADVSLGFGFSPGTGIGDSGPSPVNGVGVVDVTGDFAVSGAGSQSSSPVDATGAIAITNDFTVAGVGGIEDQIGLASASFGPFADANHYGTTAGADASRDFTVNRTLGLLVEITAISSFQTPIAYCDSTHGWVMRFSTATSLLRFRGGTDMTFTGLVQTFGLLHLWVTRKASGEVRFSNDGRPALQMQFGSAPTYVAGGASSKLSIGRNTGESANSATGMRILHVVWIDAEASDAELAAWSGQATHATERYLPHSAARSHASLLSWISADRDHVQANASIVAGAGSAPWTVPKIGTGAAHNTIKAERRHVLLASEIHDGRRFDVSTGGNIRHGACSQVKVSGSVSKLLFDVYSNNKDRAGVFVDDVAGTNTNTANDGWQLTNRDSSNNGTGMSVVRCPGIDGSAHSVRAVDDWQALSTDPTFTSVQAVRWPADESLTITPYAAPTKRLHIETDSLMQNVEESTSVSGGVFSAIALLRANLAASGWEVSADGYGSRQLNFGESTAAPDNNISTSAGRTALANKTVSNLDGTSENRLFFCLGTNDWGTAGALSKAAWKTNAGATVDAIKARADALGIPTFSLWWLTPTTRPNETNPNDGGATLQDYRDAIAEIAAAGRSAWMHVIDGPSTVTSTPVDNYGATTHLHWKKTGHAQADTNIRSAMGL